MILSTRIRSNHRLNKIVLFLTPPLCLSARPDNIMSERERAADGDLNVAEESPPTHRARSRTQVRVARVTAMAQKRHGLFSVMMRLSLHKARSRVSLRVTRWAFTKQDTMKRRIPAGASQNRTIRTPGFRPGLAQ